jgi:CheY-like chemotaxis protein
MGVGNVLVVEDDEAVLRSTKRMVERLGYVVLAAKCSEEALHIAADKSIEVDLLFTDVVMPGMSGLELWERVRLIRPKLRVLFASGYTRDVEIMQQVLTDGLGFIEKPFSLDVLSVKMSEILAT